MNKISNLLLDLLTPIPNRSRDEIETTIVKLRNAWVSKDIQLLCFFSGFLVEQITVLVHQIKGVDRRVKGRNIKVKELLAALAPLSTQQYSWDETIHLMNQDNLTFGSNSTVNDLIGYGKTVFKYRNLAAHPTPKFRDVTLTDAQYVVEAAFYISYCAVEQVLKEKTKESADLEIFIGKGRLFTGLLEQKFHPESLGNFTKSQQAKIGKALGRRASYATHNAYFEGIYPASKSCHTYTLPHFWFATLQGLLTYFTDHRTLRIDYTSVSVALETICNIRVEIEEFQKSMGGIIDETKGVQEAWLFSGDKQKTVSLSQQYLYDRLMQTSQHFSTNSKLNHQFEELATNIANIKKIT